MEMPDVDEELFEALDYFWVIDVDPEIKCILQSTCHGVLELFILFAQIIRIASMRAAHK